MKINLLRPLLCGFLLLPLAGLAKTPVDRGVRCLQDKTRAAGEYGICLGRAAKLSKVQLQEKRILRCDQSLQRQFTKAETRARGACPTSNDYLRIQLAAKQHQQAVQAVLGSPLKETGPCTAPGVNFAYSYLVTNRATPFATEQPQILPVAPGGLSYFTAEGPYQSSKPQTHYQPVSREVFLSRLTADLAKASAAGAAQLGVYVHGLGNLFGEAITETAQFGCGLAQSGQWPGLLIGFSWPSYDVLDSGLFYASKPPPLPPLDPQLSGTIRDNVLGSRTSFGALLNLLQTDIIAKSATPVELSLLTHSEGNYMLMAGLAGMSAPPSLAHCLLLAADISAASLQAGGQGQAITQACRDVTVYYSGADITLGASNYEFATYHLPDFPTRLGMIGPNYGAAPPQELPANVTGVDCSRVTLDPAVPSIIDVHSSNRSVPSILADLSRTLQGLPPAQREPISGTVQGFVLKP